jgi:hypothetical protein
MLLVKNCMMSIELAEAASKGQLRVMMNFQTHTYQAKGLYVVSSSVGSDKLDKR